MIVTGSFAPIMLSFYSCAPRFVFYFCERLRLRLIGLL